MVFKNHAVVIHSFLVTTLLSCSSLAWADQVELLIGYVNLDRRGTPHFVSVDLKEETLTAALTLHNFFTKGQVNAMERCMNRKTTHAITIEVHPSVQHNVPNGYGGTTTTHFPEFKNVRCVSAPGFLNQWREIVRNSNFR